MDAPEEGRLRLTIIGGTVVMIGGKDTDDSEYSTRVWRYFKANFCAALKLIYGVSWGLGATRRMRRVQGSHWLFQG